MTVFPVLTRSDLDDVQRTFWDELMLGPRGFYTGGGDGAAPGPSPCRQPEGRRWMR
jgi:hypothetical protein